MIPMHKVFMPDNIDEIMEPLRKVIESGWIGEGPKVLEFEKHIGDYIGSYQARLSTKETTLTNAITNTEASRSRIADADFAKEQLEALKLQIMQQTATSALAQANSALLILFPVASRNCLVPNS